MFESVRSILNRPQAGGTAAVRGWVRTVRHSKSCSFLAIYDGSCFAALQVVVAPASAAYEEAKRLRTGCAVEVWGEIVASPGQEQKYEIQAARLKTLGQVDDDYPLQKKATSYEFLRTVAHLR
ncbi:MAG: OB-fold nucleic acid binding domain-containing protein, partial [Planctomycetota bacterium]|nr:OB-fold nucleic acid binding domain-containing protein [Planctomycetota bacterium]